MFIMAITASVLAAPSVVAFRPVSKPATRAPYTILETIKQGKLVRLCDPHPSKPIHFVPAEQISKRVKTLFDADQADREGSPHLQRKKLKK